MASAPDAIDSIVDAVLSASKRKCSTPSAHSAASAHSSSVQAVVQPIRFQHHGEMDVETDPRWSDPHKSPVIPALPRCNHEPSETSMSTMSAGGNAYRRINMWSVRKQSRLEKQRREAEEEKLKECTFRPLRPTVDCDASLLEPSAIYKDNKSWGFDAFVDRYVEARRKKDEETRYVEEYWASPGDKWKPQRTVPEPFELGQPAKNHYGISCLRSPFDTLAPKLRPQHYATPSTIEAPAVPSGTFSLRSSTAVIEHATCGDHSPQQRPAFTTP